MKITIDEIAKLAGVSKTTVSRVLNNKPDVSESTRQHILELIAEYDFQPNVFAKSISLQKSYNIGLIIPHEVDHIFANQFYVEVLRGVSTEVDQAGYYLLVVYPHDHNFVDIYKQKKIDGFVLMSPGRFHRSIIETLQAAEAPFISTAKMYGQEQMVFVDVDNYYGATLAIDHLVSLGHKRIAFIGKPALTSSQDRLEGYKATLERYGLPFDESLVKVSESSSTNSGYQAMQELLKQGRPISAVFLANDVMSIGAIKALEDNGKRVPEDVSVVGFDDILLARYSKPPLTTIRQPAFQKGRLAAKMLIEFLENKTQPESITLDVELVIRNSTAKFG